MASRLLPIAWVLAAWGCGACASKPVVGSPTGLLVPVSETDLPGHANRFDYQDLDPAHGHLIIAHMNDSNVVVANLAEKAAPRRARYGEEGEPPSGRNIRASGVALNPASTSRRHDRTRDVPAGLH